MRKFLGIAIVSASLLAGCRFKGGESFLAATTPNPPGTWQGDPGTSVGIAESTGGLNAKTPYGAGANPNATATLNPGYDQPLKGVGQQPGEYPVRAAAGFGNSNSPANQPMPNDASAISVRTGQ
jgi:hypothetical protein